ncbi:ATP-binding cassette domain-containing protein [Bacillus sp. Cs-700]|uniref:ABC transporter ATP-binding protein n=1 Tax=Bacillus sp. Cs-700 TaxID=2589818 RepID=UPI00140B3DF6|nr:ATP-binding cassette domain-containing protein [Bacillus sp. Cs-700]
MANVLEVKGLGKRFKHGAIIENLSFHVKKGEIMAILGPNGAGKSTTIRSVLGILYPDEGEILYQGESIKKIPPKRIGYLPEERGLYKNVNVIDILLYFADLKDYPIRKAKQRARFYLKKFGLEDKEKVRMEELSKGMGQKIQFIASIIHEPEILILDEPFSGLDPVSQELFQKEIKELADQGTAILLSSHQMNLIETLGDRLLFIHKGKEVVTGSIHDVKAQFSNYKCTIRGENARSLLETIPMVDRIEQKNKTSILFLEKEVELTRWLSTLPKKLDIQELRLDRISLHDIFVSIASDRKDLAYEK